MQYRSDIDGLRAVAVIPVILFHMGFPLFQAGFLGVDVFFVISGFLITKILLDEKRDGKFSIIKFYDRRARRILPALFFVIALSIIFSWLVMVPSQIKDFGQSIIAALGFSSNIYFWLKLDYWGQSAEYIPLLHIWSLAVEEQFYLIFPFVVLLAKTSASLRLITIVITVVSFAAMVLMQTKGFVSEAFYLPFFRAWELAAGSLAATISLNNIKPKFATALSSLGLVMLLTSLLMFTSSTNYAILYGAPVVGTFLIIMFSRPNSIVYRLLSIRALVVTGLASYSLYLLHQPVLAFFRIYRIESLSIVNNIICMLIIVALSVFSYQFIEKPFRLKRFALRPWYYVGLLIIAIAFTLFGLAAHKTEGFNEYKLSQMPEEKARMIDLISKEMTERVRLSDKYDAVSAKEYANDGRIRLLFVGDSVSGDLYAAAEESSMKEIAEIRSFALLEECYGVKTTFPTCDEDVAEFVNSTLLIEADVIVVANSFLPETAGSLGNFLTFGNIHEKKVIIYRQHQFMHINSVIMLGNKFNYDYTSEKLSTFVYNNRHERTLESNKIIEQFAIENNISTINGFDFFCDDELMQCQLFDQKGSPMLLDIVHLTPTGLYEFAPWFQKSLVPLL